MFHMEHLNIQGASERSIVAATMPPRFQAEAIQPPASAMAKMTGAVTDTDILSGLGFQGLGLRQDPDPWQTDRETP